MTEKPQNVRLATKQDEDQVFTVLMKAYEDNAMFSLSPARVWHTIRRATDRKGGLIGVIDGPDGIEACVGMFLCQFFYTDEWHLSEYWNFVVPECRKTNHAKDLITFAKWCSEQMQIPLHMGILTTKRLAAKERLYRRQLPKVGAYFMYGKKEVDDIPLEQEVN